jgi:putative ATP-dependent endonuclease of OLD family
VSLGSNKDRTLPETVGPFYSAAATSDIKTGLFARACVLVEGDTERYALPELIAMYGYDVLRLGVALIPVGGVGNLAKWYRLFTIMQILTFPIFDTDSDKTGRENVERERDRRDLLSALGENPDLANLLNESPLYIGEKFAAFNSNFEAAMTTIIPTRWLQLTQTSKEFVGDSKPLQARYAAKKLSQQDITDTGKDLLRGLSTAIAVCFGHSHRKFRQSQVGPIRPVR